RVSGLGYRVEVGTRGLFTRFEVETPAGVQYRGFEPGRRLTPNGALLVLAGPLVLAAVLVAFGVLAPRLPPFLPVLVLLGAALAGGGVARLRWRWAAAPARPAAGRGRAPPGARLRARGVS